MKSEHEEQVEFVKWASKKQKDIPGLSTLFAIPNAGQRSLQVLNYYKSEGLKTGVPDLFLATPNNNYHGLFIEMKIGKNKLTKEQARWAVMLGMNDYKHIVCYSGLEAKTKIMNYLFPGVNFEKTFFL
jgi:hypothetical protein